MYKHLSKQKRNDSGSDTTPLCRKVTKWKVAGWRQLKARQRQRPDVKKYVYPIKSQNRRASYAEKCWQYAEPRPGMRKALQALSRFIATPSVSKHRVFAWIDPVVLCNQKVIVFARDDDYFFGVLHSRVHEVWSLATASRHGVGNDPTYNTTTCFETFPFPWPPGQEPTDNPIVAAIAAAVRDLVEKRDRWLNPEGGERGRSQKAHPD
jgi:hypothetical protein